MKLELGIIPINDIQFGAESKVENGTIYVNADELKALILEDENLKSVELDIARPGESVRIMPVKDVIEPRVKVEGRGGVFPGVINKVDTVGERLWEADVQTYFAAAQLLQLVRSWASRKVSST